MSAVLGARTAKVGPSVDSTAPELAPGDSIAGLRSTPGGGGGGHAGGAGRTGGGSSAGAAFDMDAAFLAALMKTLKDSAARK